MVNHAYTHLPTGDLQAIARLHKWGGEALVREITAIFLREAPKRLLAARQAASVGECVATERAAHSLKSSSAQLGAPRMQHISERIEILAAQGQLDPVSSLIDALETEFARFVAWMDRTTKMVARPEGQGPGGEEA